MFQMFVHISAQRVDDYGGDAARREAFCVGACRKLRSYEQPVFGHVSDDYITTGQKNMAAILHLFAKNAYLCAH